jgi:sialidase-1
MKGFTLVPSWKPADDEKQSNGQKVGVREGFVNVPALVGTEPGAEFEFTFEGTACGLFIATGPDAGQIEFSMDGGAWRTLDTVTQWSSGLHLPWALILDDQLKPGSHIARVRLAVSNPPSRSAMRVFHLLLN